MSTRDLVLISLFAAIIVAFGLVPPIMLGFIPVPITAQSLGVMLAGTILGAKRGGLAVALVIVLVVIGMPVLSGGRGGLAVFAGPTVGFFIGWIPAVIVTGLIAQCVAKRTQSSFWQLIGFISAAIIGCIIVLYAAGVLGIVLITGLSFEKALLSSLVFVPGDMIKTIAAGFAARSVLAGYPLLTDNR